MFRPSCRPISTTCNCSSKSNEMEASAIDMNVADDSHQLNDEIMLLLSGQGLVSPGPAWNESRGQDQTFIPHIKTNVTYIVAGVLINSEEKILMMQEAKHSCKGLWYLPAGRLEKNETLVEGCRREVEEETGIICEPLSLIAVEAGMDFLWLRFTFLCEEKGGSLKTCNEADAESLQAAWLARKDISRKSRHYPLRGSDILRLIDFGLSCHQYVISDSPSANQHPTLLPVLQKHNHIALRVVIVHKNKDGRRLVVMILFYQLMLVFCQWSTTVDLPTLTTVCVSPYWSLSLLHHKVSGGTS